MKETRENKARTRECVWSNMRKMNLNEDRFNQDTQPSEGTYCALPS